jgi:hypothetical protein
MDLKIIETDRGAIWLWGRPEAFSGGRPVVLVIRGTFPERNNLEWLDLASHDLVFAHLPGFYCPLAAANSIEGFIASFDTAIRTSFAERRLIVLGSSTGALVAAGLRSPQIVARMLIEPFFSTAKLTDLAAVLRTSMARIEQPTFNDWVWDVLGIAAERTEDRDYAHLLRGDLPIYALLGDPQRPVVAPERLPTLTDATDRERLIAAGAQLRQAAAGHDVPYADAQAILATLREVAQAHP